MSVPAGFVIQKLRPTPPFNLLVWRHFSAFPVSFASQISSKTFNPFRESDTRVMLIACVRDDNMSLGASIHASIIKNPPFIDFGYQSNNANSLVIYNCLLHLYCKNGEVGNAVKVFVDMPLKDTVSWNTLVSGFLKVGNLETGYWYFRSMFESEIYRFDHKSLNSILTSCRGVESFGIVMMIHALAISNGYEKEVTIGNTLTTSYFRCRSFDSGMTVFYEMVVRDVITWTATISGLEQNELYSESLMLFAEMCRSTVSPNHVTYLSAVSACSGLQVLEKGAQIHGLLLKLGIESDLCMKTALMNMYSKCGRVEDAWLIFESVEAIDEVSVTVMLASLAQNGFEEEAVQMFVKTVKSGLVLDPDMISAVLGVFGMDTSRGLGGQVHSLVIRKGFTSNFFVSNGLINMYSKCGELEESVKIFDSMPQKNQVSWNSMIAAFARHGDALKALELYENMSLNGVEPSQITFLSLLHACSHAGFVQKGVEFFETMKKSYRLQPTSDHYACIIDILGRAGLVNEAKLFIKGEIVNPDELIWESLLGACSIHGDSVTGKYAADQLAEAAPDSRVPYVSMASIYSSRGEWKERARTIKKMKERGVAKGTGMSWIEIGKKIHSFVVADKVDGDACILLVMLFNNMRDEGICWKGAFLDSI